MWLAYGALRVKWNGPTQVKASVTMLVSPSEH